MVLGELVGTATVITQGPLGRLRHDAKGGDFYLATSGDLDLATSGDFLMATDTRGWEVHDSFNFSTCFVSPEALRPRGSE